MGFCIYCNYKVNTSATTCPKCYRTLTLANQQPPALPFSLEKRALNHTDKWQDTYGKKAIFKNTPQPSRSIPHFNNVDSLKLKRNMKICAHCHEKKETSLDNHTTTFYCKTCLAEKLTCPPCKQHFSESDTQTTNYNQQLWHTECFKCHQCENPLKPMLTVLDKDGHPSCRACQLRNAVAAEHSPISTSQSTPILSQKTEKKRRHKNKVKRPCRECGLHVFKKDYRGLKIQTGEIFCFHSNCLLCSKCNQHFQSLEFYTDGQHFYHTECVHPVLSDSPVSEEEEVNYPQTPPSHDDDSNYFPSDELQQKKLPTTTTITCTECGESVTDDACLELDNSFYHKECLVCAGCNKTVSAETKLTKVKDKLFCEHCIRAKRNSTTPSDIFKSRKTVLPRLGGVRTCAGCNLSMPFSDYQPGPNASRWHKKCLCCAGCQKQMDSDAHMTINEKTGLYSVHCRDCLDDTPKPKYVR